MEDLSVEPLQTPPGVGYPYNPKTPTYWGSPTPPRQQPATRDAEVQVDILVDSRDRVRRQIFQDPPYIGHLRLIPEPEHGPDPLLKAISSRVDLREQRRLCGCERCVRHATRLAQEVYAADLPLDPGVQFVVLPGIVLTNSTTPDRRQLAEHLIRHRERMLVVCSSTGCTLHRNFVAVWTTARRYAMPDRTRRHPPEAGGCHDCEDRN